MAFRNILAATLLASAAATVAHAAPASGQVRPAAVFTTEAWDWDANGAAPSRAVKPQALFTTEAWDWDADGKAPALRTVRPAAVFTTERWDWDANGNAVLAAVPSPETDGVEDRIALRAERLLALLQLPAQAPSAAQAEPRK